MDTSHTTVPFGEVAVNSFDNDQTDTDPFEETAPPEVPAVRIGEVLTDSGVLQVAHVNTPYLGDAWAAIEASGVLKGKELIALKSQMGTGKTYLMVLLLALVEYFTLISFRVKLVRHLAERFGAWCYDQHVDFPVEFDLATGEEIQHSKKDMQKWIGRVAAKLAITIHSLFKFDRKGVVFVDDANGALDELGAGETLGRLGEETFPEKRLKAVNAMRRTLHQAPLAYIADALLTADDVVEWAWLAGKPIEKAVLIVNDFRPHRGTAVMFSSEAAVREAAVNAAAGEGSFDDEPPAVFYCDTTKAGAEVVVSLAQQKGARALAVTSGTSNSTSVREWLANPQATPETTYGMVGASPTMDNGFSLDTNAKGEALFTMLFACMGGKGASLGSGFQGTGRPRGSDLRLGWYAPEPTGAKPVTAKALEDAQWALFCAQARKLQGPDVDGEPCLDRKRFEPVLRVYGFTEARRRNRLALGRDWVQATLYEAGWDHAAPAPVDPVKEAAWRREERSGRDDLRAEAVHAVMTAPAVPADNALAAEWRAFDALDEPEKQAAFKARAAAHRAGLDDVPADGTPEREDMRFVVDHTAGQILIAELWWDESGQLARARDLRSYGYQIEERAVEWVHDGDFDVPSKMAWRWAQDVKRCWAPQDQQHLARLRSLVVEALAAANLTRGMLVRDGTFEFKAADLEGFVAFAKAHRGDFKYFFDIQAPADTSGAVRAFKTLLWRLGLDVSGGRTRSGGSSGTYTAVVPPQLTRILARRAAWRKAQGAVGKGADQGGSAGEAGSTGEASPVNKCTPKGKCTPESEAGLPGLRSPENRRAFDRAQAVPGSTPQRGPRLAPPGLPTPREPAVDDSSPGAVPEPSEAENTTMPTTGPAPLVPLDHSRGGCGAPPTAPPAEPPDPSALAATKITDRYGRWAMRALPLVVGAGLDAYLDGLDETAARTEDPKEKAHAWKRAIGRRGMIPMTAAGGQFTFGACERRGAGRWFTRGPSVHGIAKDLRPFLQPPDGMVFLDADYSTLHPRVAAIRCGDTFLSHGDPYASLAQEVAKTYNPDVDPTELRRAMKKVVAGMLNGESPIGIAKELEPILGDRAGDAGAAVHAWVLGQCPGLAQILAQVEVLWGDALGWARTHDKLDSDATTTVASLTGKKVPFKLHFPTWKQLQKGETGWRTMASALWTATEAQAMDLILERLPELLEPYGGGLICPSFDGLLAAVKAEHAEVAGRGLAALFRWAAEQAGIPGVGVKVKIQSAWGVDLEGQPDLSIPAEIPELGEVLAPVFELKGYGVLSPPSADDYTGGPFEDVPSGVVPAPAAAADPFAEHVVGQDAEQDASAGPFADEIGLGALAAAEADPFADCEVDTDPRGSEVPASGNEPVLFGGAPEDYGQDCEEYSCVVDACETPDDFDGDWSEPYDCYENVEVAAAK
ncbi:MAG: hypothetical protein ABIO70_34795 [Pseudomonadota bacterium]